MQWTAEKKGKACHMIARLLLVLLLVVGLYVRWLRPAPAFGGTPGLEPALSHLQVGRSVSPQYHGQLLGELSVASKAFEDSYGTSWSPSVLRAQLPRCRSAVQELIDRAPVDARTASELERGKALMTATLLAWLEDALARWKLRSEPGDARHFWNRYYELPC